MNDDVFVERVRNKSMERKNMVIRLLLTKLAWTQLALPGSSPRTALMYDCLCLISPVSNVNN